MSFVPMLLIGFALLMLLVLVWVLRDPRKHASHDGNLDSSEEFGWRHVSFFPQVRQALDNGGLCLSLLARINSSDAQNAQGAAKDCTGLSCLASVGIS